MNNTVPLSAPYIHVEEVSAANNNILDNKRGHKDSRNIYPEPRFWFGVLHPERGYGRCGDASDGI